MDGIPQWAWPLLTLSSSALGSWAAVKISIARLEVQMARAIEDIQAIRKEISIHNDDLSVHDAEIASVLLKLALPRVRRQALRRRDR